MATGDDPSSFSGAGANASNNTRGRSEKKRKRKVLALEVKVEILKELKRGVSATFLSERYGVGKSTVSNVKNGIFN